jgi:hypothetical protein
MAKQSSFMKMFSEPYLADLGRVVAAWSHVEFQFNLLFLSVVVMQGASSGSMTNPRVRMLGLEFKRRIEAFRERMGELDVPPDIQKDVEKALSQLGNLRNERDAIAHSVFDPHVNPDGTLSGDVARALVKSWKNQKPIEEKTLSQKRLKKIFQQIDALYWDLSSLHLRSLTQFRPR